MVQARAAVGQGPAGEPRRLQGLGPRGHVAGLGHDARQGVGHQPDALLGDGQEHGVGALGIERLHPVGDGVETRGDADRRGQGQAEVDVVDHRLGHHPDGALGGLAAGLGLAQHRRHLRAGVGGGDGDLGQVGPQRQRLGKPDGRAAADRDEAVRALGLDHRHGLFGDLDGRVHGRSGEDRPAGLAQQRHRPLGHGTLRAGADHQQALAGQGRGLFGQAVQGAFAEHHP